MMRGSNTDVAAILPLIPMGSVGVELGVWRGASSVRFLERARHMHLVDPWSVDPYRDGGEWREYLARYGVGRSAQDLQMEYDVVYGELLKLMSGRPVMIYRMTSAAFFAAGPPEADWIYIDGSHAYEDVLCDLRLSAEAGYTIMGDDYGNKPGVTLAVDRFVAETGLSLSRHGRQQFILRP